jgi:hypothetical protein
MGLLVRERGVLGLGGVVGLFEERGYALSTPVEKRMGFFMRWADCIYEQSKQARRSGLGIHLFFNVKSSNSSFLYTKFWAFNCLAHGTGVAFSCSLLRQAVVWCFNCIWYTAGGLDIEA